MTVKDAPERAMAQRQVANWNQLALKAGIRASSLYLIRDGREDTAQFKTIRAVVEALGMTFAELLGDTPGWADRVALAMRGLSRSDQKLLAGILGRMAVSRTAEEVRRLAALSEALSFPSHKP